MTIFTQGCTSTTCPVTMANGGILVAAAGGVTRAHDASFDDLSVSHAAGWPGTPA